MTRTVFLPSFYGLVTWLVAYSLYVANILPWEPVSVEVHLIFATQIAMFMVASVIFTPVLNLGGAKRSLKLPPVSIVLVLHAIGFVGIAKFAADFSPYLDEGFLGTLMGESWKIRALGASITSIGTQISYIGWLAIGVSLSYRKPGFLLICICLLQFLANLVFIDRTRPVWIIFTAILCFMWSRERISGRSLARTFTALGILFVAIFAGVAIWSGKTGEGVFGGELNPLVGSLYLYLTAGYAYFGHMLQIEPSPSYFEPVRVLAPMMTVLHGLGFAAPPPNQILDFYEMPFPSNVGTALEPFFRDGGLGFVLFGMLVHSFGFNVLGTWLLKSGNAVSLYAWATLCFCNLISFFTPKIGNFPVWLFVGMGLVAGMVKGLKRSGAGR